MIDIEPVVGISPFERPDARLVVALARAGALGVLDLGRDSAVAEQALSVLMRRAPRGFGVRIPAGIDVPALPQEARVVVVPASTPVARWKDRIVLVQVTSLAEARTALAHGATGLIAKGNEAGGRVGDEPTFILLQKILRELQAPVWAQGGVGLHTAAGCIAAGARGVVLDTQLSLMAESSAGEEVKRLVSSMDGSETRVVGEHRIFARPGTTPPPDDSTPDVVAASLSAKEGERGLLPVGQDAAFARPLADRFQRVEALVQGMRAAMGGHIRQARACKPIGPSSPLAVQHGVTYPIAQGPMTRVSDRASFASAVAQAGGLPFVALSLMRGAEAKRVLEETSSALAGRPWGVGVLGFVPPEIRDEQLALVLEARPTVALVAGGRPSHARPLEQAGIATYLHVPSPGLLDLFLKDGARRFVFEGRECGGHVGPRSSFVLWESAVERLLAWGDVRDVSVLFAGGIHDARSAAMVSAMAAPLAVRGAKIGVLMGTAYLFTEEAVSTGAILPGFQEEAMRCERTVLLETAPGHATRCADTEYAREFEAERRRLEREGASRQDMWAALEQLNLGRLRIAAKGLRREADRIEAIDERTQRREGMYMIGQVASLRSTRCTMAELHQDVSEGAARVLASAALPPQPARSGKPVDVAIIGMACLFPDAPNLAAFWKNVVLGANAIREVPPDRWNPDLYFDPAGTGDKTPSKWGGFLPEVAFDPMAFGIPPKSLAAIDPVQLLSLEVARRALEDADYVKRDFDRERTSVIFGAESGTELASGYGFRAAYPQLQGEVSEELDFHLPKLTEDSFAGVLANVIAGRIANRLDLGGVNYTVDAACASSLAAVDLACKELAAGTSEMVIAGGADVHNSINDYLLFASVHALSPTGQCRTFDASADGITLGEGVAAVVLKRLADAERDGDRIYAVIKGVGGSSDGKSLGLTAPRKEGQARALLRAYDAAGVSPSDVGLIEAHGTGTVVGDRTELATLTDVFSASGALPRECTLGSVKTNIGHTKCAAGLAGLIKAALAVHRGVLPPTLNLETPNPAYDPHTSPFAFRRTASPWTESTRRAGVSAFGFGGTNFHVVLSSASTSAPAVGLDDWPSELFLFRGADRAAAERKVADLASFLRTDAPLRLRDLARSITEARPSDPVQVAIVARSVDDLRNKLGALTSGGVDVRVPGIHVANARYSPAQVAFLFPGQGSQRPGMLADLFVTFPELRELLRLGSKWLPALFPPAAHTDEQRAAQKGAITDTRVAQPTLGMAGLAMARLLARFGVRPAMVGGHSYGELVALTVAGALPESALLSLSEARAAAILEAARGAPGTMAAVGGSEKAVRHALADASGVTIANHNAPDQTVIAGSEEAIARAIERLMGQGIAARKIAVACAFHSPIVAGASEAFARELARIRVGEAGVPVYSNSTAERYPRDADAIRWQLARQLALPVRFAEQVEAMYEAGARVFVEAGPGGVLSDLVGRVLKGKPHVAIRCDRTDTHGVEGLLGALGELAVAGVAIDAAALFGDRDTKVLDLASPPTVPSTAWLVNGYRAAPVEGELPDNALRIPSAPLSKASIEVVASTDREAALLEYLRGMRDVVDSQRQVMLEYLGASTGGEDALVVEGVEAEPPALPPRSTSSSRPPPRPSTRPPPRPSTKPPPRASTRPPPPAQAGKSTPPARADLTPLAALVSTVSERTGYPAEMLDPDLDLEADLGIDSIKRIEILGAMRDRLGLGSMSDAARSDALEELARFKTLRKIAGWLEERVGAGPKSAPPPATSPPITLQSVAATSGSVGRVDVARFIFEVSTTPPPAPNGLQLEGRTFALTNDRAGVAARLCALLEAKGARVRMLSPGDAVGDADGIVHLESLTPDSHDSLRALFDLSQGAVRGKAKWLYAATGLGGAFGRQAAAPQGTGGAAGLLKSVAKERPDLRVRAVDLHPGEDADTLAGHLYDEILADDPHVEVGYAGGVRHVLRTVERPAPDSLCLVLDRDAVVLVTGGARGITAEVSVALARRFGCRLELVGRTPLDGPEDEELAKAPDAPAIRRLLLQRANGAGLVTPTTIEQACRATLAAREVRRTLARIEEAGGRASYHSVDVRDARAFGALVDAIYDRQGRIDGAIHGAGIIEDKLLTDKTRESFDRVFDTKVKSALTLTDRLRADVRFVVFFSSVSGAFGNRGQVDYAAANDALDKLAHQLASRLPARVVSINWGPWSGVGMVSPELEREYERRGVPTISPERGAARFVEELCRGRDAQVILAPFGAGFE